MTLPFRRRHHDDEGGHDRARSLVSREMLEALGTDESGWLTRHLERCAECRRDRDAYRADRDLLRRLREHPPEPPRDLWAQTAAALDREARRRPRRAGARAAPAAGGGPGGRSGWRAMPLGAAAGALVLLVVIGATFVRPTPPPGETPAGTAVARITEVPGPTPITVAANPVSFIRATADGSWELVISPVDEVCPRVDPECRPLLDDGPSRPVNLGTRPATVTISPDEDRLVVEDPGDASRPGRIVIVPLASQGPATTPDPATQPPTIGPDPSASADPQTPEPSSPSPASPEPTPAATPIGQIEILTGATVVGDVAYSEDGTWLAFSAMPSDGSTGPDLYLWSVGQPTALAVTTDHATYFSSWLDGRVLASHVQLSVDPGASGEPAGSTEPSSAIPSDVPAGPTEAHASSFLLDPASLVRTELAQPDVWLPVVDPTGSFVAYWSGTVRSDDGLQWDLATGELVLDAWTDGTTTNPEPTSAASPDGGAASNDPSATTTPAIGPGPAGAPVTIVPGTTAAFKATFDPTGTRLAVWVGEDTGDDVGRLHLVVLDPETGELDPALDPLPGTPALRRFSIDRGRLAWVTPKGQDGNASSVQVLGWSNDDFGEIKTLPGQDLRIVR